MSRLLKTFIALTVVLMACATGAMANSYAIQYNGFNLTATGVTPGTEVFINVPSSFVGQVQLNGTSVSDSAVGSPISGTSFNYFSNGTFTPSSTAFQVGSSASTGGGLLTGSVVFVSLTSNGAGGFGISINLTGMSYSCTAGCTSSAALASFASGGSGTITFQGVFNGSSVNTVADLLNLPAGQSINGSSWSGTSVSAVPEPASLALLGTGLGALALLRKKLMP